MTQLANSLVEGLRTRLGKDAWLLPKIDVSDSEGGISQYRPDTSSTIDLLVSVDKGVATNAVVSVIVPTYNRWRYLPATIESFLAQTFKEPYEIIIVDDGSTDGTFEKLQQTYRNEIESGKIRIFRKEQNSGPGAARNVGLRNAKGNRVCVHDDDDIALSNKLKDLSDYLNANPNVGLVHAKFSLIDKGGKEVSPESDPVGRHFSRLHANPDSLIYERLLRECFINASTTMFRKNIIDIVGYYDENLLQAQDYDYWLRIADESQIGFLDKVVAQYRRHGGSITEYAREKQARCTEVARKKVELRKKFGKNLGILVMFSDLHSGIGRAAIEQAEALFKEGVTNVTLLRKGIDPSNSPIFYVMNLDSGILDPQHKGQYSSYYQNPRNWRTYLNFNSVLTEMDYKPDVVHLHYPNCVSELKAIQDCRIAIVYTADLLAAYVGHPGTDRRDIAKLEKQVMGIADRIVALTPANREEIIKHYPQFRDKIEVIPNGVRI